MKRPQGLDDPQIAAHAWARYRRIMTIMAALGVVIVAVVLGWFKLMDKPMPVHMVIATSLGVWCTFMLGTGLMALLFLSSGTGHDEQVEDRLGKEFHIDD